LTPASPLVDQLYRTKTA